MKTITILELRQNTAAVVQELRRGLAMTLTYRGRPLARLEPILSMAESIAADDPLYRLAEQAGCADDDTKGGEGKRALHQRGHRLRPVW